MRLTVQVIKVYEVETDGGDTTDPDSVAAHVEYVENMSSTEIESEGDLKDVSTDFVEVVGPDDED